MAAGNGYTPTERRILEVLSDGRPHRREELHACLDDELAALQAIQRHISMIRQSLRPRGQDIICELVNRQIHYRQVRLLASPYDGKR